MKVLIPGSFDPWHNGHQHVYDEACEIFGKNNVFIGIAYNPSKDPTCDKTKFKKWCMNTVTDNIVIINGLVAEYCRDNNFSKIIRGVRQGYDLELEEKLTHWNFELGGIRTIYIPTPSESAFVSSSFLREIKQYKNINFLQKHMPRHVAGRWKYNTKIPKHVIYYGRSCVGKSTYLKKKFDSYHSEMDCVEGDKLIWDILNWDSERVEDSKLILKDDIMENNKGGYDFTIAFIIRDLKNKWDKIFKPEYMNLDFPVIGNYFYFIPDEIKYCYNYIKLTTTDTKRQERISKRGLDEKWIKALDKFYKESIFCDEIINI